jgi:hypothetical protein
VIAIDLIANYRFRRSSFGSSVGDMATHDTQAPVTLAIAPRSPRARLRQSSLVWALTGRGLHFTVKSVLDRVPCPGLVAVQVADMPAAVLVPVWRAAADNDGIHAFAAVASSLRRPND